MKKFALAGNPNSGKTTLFNVLTGSTAHVGNWPGVTVDRKEGVYKKLSEPVTIVDLPGIYSLSPYTPEEVVSRNFILDEKPDCIINIVDATNLERNLYLTTQLIETDVPVAVALNMTDVTEKRGDRIDAAYLESKLGLPVVEISALKGKGIHELMKRALAASKEKRQARTVCGSGVGELIENIRGSLEAKGVSSPLFHAVKIAENDEIDVGAYKDEAKTVGQFKKEFSDDVFGDDFEALIADSRYKYISGELSPALKRGKREKFTPSDKADKVLTHKIFGIPVFLAILFAVFHLTFSEDLFYISAMAKGLPSLDELGLDTGNPGVRLLACFYDGAVFSPGVMLTNLLSLVLDGISGAAGGWLSSSPLWLSGFIVDGVLGGLFAVMGFLPQILTLFLFFSVLEDTGYMARVAFILDRIFRRFGLSGRAFMPMIMGFGCSLPAMINTRTLSDERERTATVRVIPFFSCGAKLPILTAVAGGIVSVFGVGNADVITYGMYLIGICTAIATVLIMRNTTMKGKVPPFIMELPSYHAPRFGSLMVHLWDKTKHFVKKAFTVILASTIIIWFLSSFSWNWQFLPEEIEYGGETVLANLRMNESILGSIGMLIQPLFTPIGFGSQLASAGWVFAVAALTGLVAKENVIATFGALAAFVAGSYIATEDGVAETVAMISATGITIPGLIAFIAFNMTTVPCFAACATAKAELPEGKFRWTLLFWLCTSYTVSCMIYLIGSWWWTSFIFAAVAAAAIVLTVLWNKRIISFGKKRVGEQ